MDSRGVDSIEISNCQAQGSAGKENLFVREMNGCESRKQQKKGGSESSRCMSGLQFHSCGWPGERNKETKKE